MRQVGSFLLGLAVLSTAGCATVIDGTSQKITVSTTPDHAQCSLTRANETIGEIENTPGIVEVDRTKNSIVVACSKPGYKSGSADDKSGSDGWVYGNFAIGGLVGFGIDFATGAHNKYTPNVEVALAPDASSQDAEPVPLVPTAKYEAPSAPAPVTAARYEAPVAPTPPPHRVFGVGVATLDTVGHGVKVMVVQDGSVAASSGIAVGDILVSLDGEPLNEKGDVRRILASRQVGAIVAVHLVRKGAPLDLAAQL